MRILDARSGIEVVPGKTVVRYPDGDWYLIEALDEGIFSARARVRGVLGGKDLKGWQPLRVRYMHPAFLFQKVAFVPS